MNRVDVRCGVGGHGQAIGSIEGTNSGVLFTRLAAPSLEENIEHERAEEVLAPYPDDPPWSGRVVGARNKLRAELSLEENDTVGGPELVPGWSWLPAWQATELGIASTKRTLRMSWKTFNDGGLDDELEYWCPRHPALSLYAPEAQKALRLQKPAIAVQFGR